MYIYDSRDMLVEEKYLRWDGENDEWMVMYWARYKYDTAGNMVQRDVEQIVGGDAKSYEDTMTYSRGDQMMTLTRSDNVNLEVCTYTMGYDYNGNMTSITRTGGGPFTDPFYEITQMEFQYDLKNRLIKYRFGGEGDWNEIKYDALGRVRERLSADETPITKKFYYDGRQLIQQLDDGNAAEFDYLRGPTGLDRQWNEASDKRYFYIKDPLGTVWAMIESGFTPEVSPLIRLYNYNAWGEHIDASDINFPDYDDDPNLMRYIGCRVEAFGTGITSQRDAVYHTDFRHYLPIIRFLQRDPKSLRQRRISEPNPYYYSRNNPINFSDPLGLQTFRGCCGGARSPRPVLPPPPGPLPSPEKPKPFPWPQFPPPYKPWSPGTYPPSVGGGGISPAKPSPGPPWPLEGYKDPAFKYCFWMSLVACGIDPFDDERWREIITAAFEISIDIVGYGQVLAVCLELLGTLGPAGVINCIIEILTELGLDYLINRFILAFVDAISGLIEWSTIYAHIHCICDEWDKCLREKGKDVMDEACCEVAATDHAFSPKNAGEWYDFIIDKCF